jgi:cytochrome c oxidase assembly protein subunit 11
MAMMSADDARALARRKRWVGWSATAVAVLMVAASYAAVPLYGFLCRATNFDGTPRRAAAPSSRVLAETVSVRFDANVEPGLAWRFEPVQRTLEVKLGENALAFFRAVNISDRTLRGIASFNVFPEQTGAYFNKLQCFCFTDQELRPGEVAEFPVSFFIDPQIVDDKDARDVRNITLSYTFHPLPAAKAGSAGKGAATTPPAPAMQPGEAGRG